MGYSYWRTLAKSRIFWT